MALDVEECCKSVHNQADSGAGMKSPACTGINDSLKLDTKRSHIDKSDSVLAGASHISKNVFIVD